MSTLQLVWSYLKSKPYNTVLNIILLSLGIAVIVILLLFSNQIKEKISDNTKGIDLVVGAKGSPLQLILCSIFHIDFPTGNIKLIEAEKIAHHRLVKYAIPLALGDSYNGFRIVGTTREFASLYKAEIAQGQWWQNDLEVTLGSQAALALRLSVGAEFASAHGLTKDGDAHEGHHYVVKGILKPTHTVMDNLIMTNVGSVWKVHESNEVADSVKNLSSSSLVPGALLDSTREITSLLIKYKNPIAAIQLPRWINGQSSLQAASPAFEAARLFSILGVGVEVMQGFAVVLIVISGLSIFIALYNSLRERQYDLAIMRTMGASRTKLFTTVLLEGATLTMLGTILGMLLGHGALYGFTQLIEQSAKAGIAADVFYPEELFLFIGSLMLGILCAFIPAIKAYKTNIHELLSRS